MPRSVYRGAACAKYSDWDAASTVAMTCNAVGLVITCLIGALAIYHFRNAKKICRTLKALFMISILFSIITLACGIWMAYVCHMGYTLESCIAITFMLFGYLLLILSLLATLITRLYWTFVSSVYRMSNSEKNTYIVVYITIVTLTFVNFALNICLIAMDKDTTQYKYVISFGLITFGMAVTLYVFTAVWTVYGFAKNLISLAKTQSSSLINIMGDNSKNNLKLNSSQQKLIDQSAKYVGLFVLAALPTIILIASVIVDAIDERSHMWRVAYCSIIGACNVTIHVITQYLQFVFASKYYRNCCKYVEVVWKLVFMRKILNAMKEEQDIQFDSLNATESVQLTSVAQSEGATSQEDS